MIFGQCDCCGTSNRVLHRGEASGLEAYACAKCRYGALADDADDLRDEIERLLSKAETGEQWAHICALEAALVEAIGSSSPSIQVKIFDAVTVDGTPFLTLRSQCDLTECFPDDPEGLRRAAFHIEAFGAAWVGGGAAPVVVLERA